MKEFFVTAKWRMDIPDSLSPAGGVIMPSGLAAHELERRKLENKYPYLKRRLLDPQLYLLGLNAATARKACANLSSYPWFPVKSRKIYDSQKHKKPSQKKAFRDSVKADVPKTWVRDLPTDDAKIADAIRQCLDLQNKLGVEAFILPAPLTIDINTSFDVELDWMERGMETAKALDANRPVYASIALSDTTVRGPDPWSNPLLDIVLDQVTARGVLNAYVVLEQSNEEGYYCTHPHSVGALLRLCDGLKSAGVTRIMIGYAGTAGLLTLAAGADAWTSGWLRSERRLKLADFEDPTGRAFPAYYSHPLAGELHLENDLDNAVAKGFLPRLADETSASKGLLAALRANKKSSVVAEWQHRMGNTPSSREHFLLASARETNALAAMSPAQARDATKAWLEKAEVLATDLYSVGSFNARTAVNHQAGWLAAFDSYEKNRAKKS